MHADRYSRLGRGSLVSLVSFAVLVAALNVCQLQGSFIDPILHSLLVSAKLLDQSS